MIAVLNNSTKLVLTHAPSSSPNPDRACDANPLFILRTASGGFAAIHQLSMWHHALH